MWAFFFEAVSCSPGWPPTWYVAEKDLELLTLLSPPPKCWNYRFVPPHPVYVVLGPEPRALCVLGKYSTS